MATPTIGEIQAEVDKLAALRGDELVLDLGPTGPAVRTMSGAAMITAENKQRLLTATRKAVKAWGQPETPRPPIEFETPDIDVDTMATWGDKAGILDSIVSFLEAEKEWSASTLDMIAEELIKAGYAEADSSGFFRAVKEGAA